MNDCDFDDLLQFKQVSLCRLQEVISIEKDSYPEDEAASPERLEMRLNRAADLFFGVFDRESDDLAGYICSTRTAGNRLTHDSMFFHAESGDVVCIHSVVVKSSMRGKRIASEMLRRYIEAMKMLTLVSNPVKELRLMCKEKRIGLYQRVGFLLLGPSDIVYGSDSWCDMKLDLH